MDQRNQIKSQQIWGLSFIFFSILIVTSTYATVPEPETLIYGQVVNLYQNNKIFLTDADVECSIRKKGSETSFTYTGAVECVKCQEYDEAGNTCKTCEKSAYLIKIPQETYPVNDETTQQVVPLLKENKQYDLVEFKVNGVKANMRIKSERGNIQPEDKQGKFILAGQPRRSHAYEVDLELVLPVADTDKDGLPDFWENQYGLNFNDPADADTDMDSDGWSNLKEFLSATNPTISNTVPVLLESEILTFEGSQILFRLNIVDSDTPPNELSIKFISIPEDISFTFYGDSAPFEHGHIIQKDDIVKLNHLENGNVILHNKVAKNITERIYVELIDGDNDPVIATVVIRTFKPTETDATDAILWTDAFSHAQKFADTPSKLIQDRSGNDNRGNYYIFNQTDESYIESDIELVANTTSGKNSVIKVNGYFELPYATPVFPDGNITMMSVFKVNPGEKDHIIASGPYYEVAVTGNNHPLHPGELKIADESTAVYSNKRIDNELIMTTVTRKGDQSFIDINSIWSGGPFSYNETSALATDPTMGGKNIWQWNFTNMAWNSTVSGAMNGLFAEMLVFDRSLEYMEKWRIYAHLLGKWFNYIISDYSQATRDMKIASISGEKNESLRLLKMEADLAWLDYSDALFANENVQQALTRLESFLPEDWQWSTIPPSVAEASQSLESIKYDYQTEFVSLYGKDKSYILIGGMGNDKLIGGYENDILIGGPGSDVLRGCSGRDVFVVTDGDDIIDFNVFDDDMIDISHLLSNTDKVINNYIHFELINDPETSEVHTMLKIDADGSGDNYDDASILLRNVTLRDQIDIASLWASGNIQAGGPRPELDVSLTIKDDQATEIPENDASFEIEFSNAALPKNLTIPLSLNGTASIGLDYQFRVPVWNENSSKYEFILVANNIIPAKLKKGDQKLLIQVVPVADHIAESLEKLSLSLLEKDDYYHITSTKSTEDSIIEISDGINEISIQTDRPIAIEGKSTAGRIIISRNGSFDISQDVNLLVKGTAENGRDVYYIPSEISFEPGATEAVIYVTAYSDKEIEDEEFVEVIVSAGDYKVRGPSSARISVRDSEQSTINSGDINFSNSIDLLDAIVALQICTGKKPAGVYVEASIKNETIGIEDVLFILKQIAR
ncbi:MAG: type I secretion C-terminal target domain-containing protein [Candidatus Magnetomorum sp.]|nr:type I secretion C-terminal target domain-containing protein [Candidatus Magnetomorum sp.]